MWEREDRKVEDTKNSLLLNWEKQTEPMMYIILTNKQANEHISSFMEETRSSDQPISKKHS